MSYVVLSVLYPELYSNVNEFLLPIPPSCVYSFFYDLKYTDKFKCRECKLKHTNVFSRYCNSCLTKRTILMPSFHKQQGGVIY